MGRRPAHIAQEDNRAVILRHQDILVTIVVKIERHGPASHVGLRERPARCRGTGKTSIPQVPVQVGPLLEAGFSLADIAFGSQLSGLKLAKFEIDAGSWPKVRAYSDWILARPSFETVIDKAENLNIE